MGEWDGQGVGVSEDLDLYTQRSRTVFDSSGPLNLNLESVLSEQCDLGQVT